MSPSSPLKKFFSAPRERSNLSAFLSTAAKSDTPFSQFRIRQLRHPAVALRRTLELLQVAVVAARTPVAGSPLSSLCGIAIDSTPPMGSSILPPADCHFPLPSSHFMNSQYSSSDFFITASGTSNLLYSAIIIGLIVRSIAYFTSYFPASGQRIMPTDGFFAPSAICAIGNCTIAPSSIYAVGNCTIS